MRRIVSWLGMIAIEFVASILSTLLLLALVGLFGWPVAIGTWAGLAIVVATIVGIWRRRRRVP